MHLCFISSFYIFVYAIIKCAKSVDVQPCVAKERNHFIFAVSKTNILQFVCWPLLFFGQGILIFKENISC